MACRVLIVRAAGSNCEHETAHAWSLAGATCDIEHVAALRDHPGQLNDYQILTIPGGFSYGDDIAAGVVFGQDLKLFLADALRAFVDRGGLILGICNGFQVLSQAGLVPGADLGADAVTLTQNTSGHYEDRWVHLAPDAACAFADDDGLMCVPVAHAEGRLVGRDRDVVSALEERGRIAFRYVDQNGQAGGYPINPNGSVRDIAGLTDETGRVLGLMPHPERHVHLTHHPSWTALPRDRTPDGLRLFRAGVRHFA